MQEIRVLSVEDHGFVSDWLESRLEEEGLIERIPYRGVLYAGLMITKGGPRVLEFNCRFGDPETQAVLPRLRTDLLELMLAAVEERLDECEMDWDPRAAVCVVMASGGYPGAYRTGLPIEGLDAEGTAGERVVDHVSPAPQLLEHPIGRVPLRLLITPPWIGAEPRSAVAQEVIDDRARRLAVTAAEKGVAERDRCRLAGCADRTRLTIIGDGLRHPSEAFVDGPSNQQRRVSEIRGRRALVEHALRSAVKRGDAHALRLLGYGAKTKVSIEDVRFDPPRVPIGGRVTMSGVYRVTYVGAESTAPSKPASRASCRHSRRVIRSG